MKKILAITSIRSDYDLMSSLYKLFLKDKNIELKMLVSGAHMSKTYGYTVDLIEKDGIDILLKIETLLDSNSKASRLKSASMLLQSSIDIVDRYNPDLILYAGDREDVIIGALLGGYLEIPTVHFYGGDHAKDGYIDNPVRHAISKLSTAHIVSIEKHRQRLLRMGESPDRIFVTGSIALDKFVNHKAISKKEIKRELNISKGFNEFAVVIFHPISEERKKAGKYFENILLALKLNNINAFVGYPNVDPGNKDIIEVINKWSSESGFIFYKNLNRDLFLSIYKNSKFIIGNSSSGIIESATVGIPAINVGMREIGRDVNENVIFCNTEVASISRAILKAVSRRFLNSLKDIKNLYGEGKSSERAYKIIKTINFKKLLYKKEDPLDVLWKQENQQFT